MADGTGPPPVVRSARIEHAAQVICDTSVAGMRWADHGEPVREIYRRRARALVEAGLLADAVPAEQPSSVDQRGNMPADIPANVVVLPEDWRHLTYYPIAGHTNPAEATDAVNALIESWRPTPAEQPDPESETCLLVDANGNHVSVDSTPGTPTVLLLACEGVDLTPDQADDVADALRAHAAARRADAKESSQ